MTNYDFYAEENGDFPQISNNIDSNGSTKNTKSNVLQIILKQAKVNLLLIATVLAVGIGIGLAFILRIYTKGLTQEEKGYFGFPGELFLRMLKFIILPLIASSMITGVAGLCTSKAGKIAARALIYYFLTTISAVILGLVLVSTIKPGKRGARSASDSGYDLLNQLISSVNIIVS